MVDVLKGECETWFKAECGDAALSTLPFLQLLMNRANTGQASPERLGTWTDSGWAFRCKWVEQVNFYFKSKSTAVDID